MTQLDMFGILLKFTEIAVPGYTYRHTALHVNFVYQAATSKGDTSKAMRANIIIICFKYSLCTLTATTQYSHDCFRMAPLVALVG